MIKASEIKSRVDELKQVSKELKEAEELKKKNDRINAEMLEIEKAINKYNRDLATEGIEKLKNYISIPITACKDVENILKDWGYIIDIVDFNDTRLYYDEAEYDKAISKNKGWKSNISETTVVPCKTNLSDILSKQSQLDSTITSNDIKTELHDSKVNKNDITKVYDKVREMTGKEPIVFGSKDGLKKLHNRKVKDECTVTEDDDVAKYTIVIPTDNKTNEGTPSLEEAIQMYYNFLNEIKVSKELLKIHNEYTKRIHSMESKNKSN